MEPEEEILRPTLIPMPGRGVYVEAGGVFNMFGGEVSKNATRSFFKNWSTGNDRIYHAYSEGGGIYPWKVLRKGYGVLP